MPSAYQGKSVDELIHNAPAVTDTLGIPDGNNKVGTLDLIHVDNSPELRDHPVLDQLVANLGNDPMAIANYVLNEIDLTDAVGYDTKTGQITDQSINPQGVSRDAMAVYLEGQGSPAEQCALLVYLLRQCKTTAQPNGIPCGYIFPQQDGMLMFDQQLSKLLRMQIRGANGPSGGLGAPELIPVNYPWVAAYINGKWTHIFPWLKDTAVIEGGDLFSYLPGSSTTTGQTFGYQTGQQWLLHYLLNDPAIRGLTTADGQITDDVGTLFPLFVQKQLQTTGTSLDQLGVNYYNRRNYFTNWQDFPRPWTAPAVSNTNLAANLDSTQNQNSYLTPILTNIFDTISVQIVSDRNNNGVADAGEPVLNTGTMRMVDLHDRRFLLRHQVTSAQGTPITATTYNLILSLEPYSSAHTSQYTFTSGSSPDPGDLLNKQLISTALQTTTNSATNDDILLFNITYNHHRQAQGLENTTHHYTPFLGFSEVTSIVDTRYLRKGEMACLSLDYGRVTQKMTEFEAEKYWDYQQVVAANPTAPTDPEQGVGQLLDIMGQSYFYKVSSLEQQVEGWTKTHAISNFGYGLVTFSPLRDATTQQNPIISSTNDLQLRYPRVDMKFNLAAYVGNSTLHLDSGNEAFLAQSSAEALVVAGSSTDEHRVINQFFQQAAAVSTVRLLDLAQGWTTATQTATTPGVGPVLLTAANYQTQGATNYTVNKTTGGGTATHTLEYWCGWTNTSQPIPAGTIWYTINSKLSDPVQGPLAFAYVTPGPETATAQSGTPFTGVGALIQSVGDYDAAISNNMVISNGGDGGELQYTIPESSPLASQIDTPILSETGDNGFSFTNPSSGLSFYTPTSYPVNDFGSVYNGLSGNNGLTAPSFSLAPDLTLELNVFGQDSYLSGAPTFGSSGQLTATGELQLQTGGSMGAPSWYSSITSSLSAGLGVIGQGIYDPVDSITGEFYINSLDLKLNGPMPLEIRRTYGSFVQADGDFGQSWKMSYFPYLQMSNDNAISNNVVTTNPTYLFAAEMDGSVIKYHLQSGSHWTIRAADNPNLSNVVNGSVGGLSNPYHNVIDLVSSGGISTFTLTGADGSKRAFVVKTYSASGSTGQGTVTVARTRPYLQTWKDNRGNYYTFNYGTTISATDYGQVNRVVSSNGDFVGFTYDTYGHITEAYTGDARHLYYQYDSYGDLIQVTLPDASTISYSYQHATAPAIVGTAVAGNGAYTANSGLITSDNNLVISGATNVNPSVLSTATAHGLQVGQIVTIAGATGNTAINGTFTVGSASFTTTTFTLIGGATPSALFSTHLIVQEIKPGGRVLQNTYDPTNLYAKRQVLTQLAPVGTTEALVTNATFNYGTPTPSGDGITFNVSTTIKDVNGKITTYTYAANQITQVNTPPQNNGSTNQNAYQVWCTSADVTAGVAPADYYGRCLKSKTDKRGLATGYQYDANGNIHIMVATGNLTGSGNNGETATTTMTYSASASNPNSILSEIDPVGNSMTYIYGDSAHPYEPTSITKAASGTTVSTETLQYEDVSGGAVSAFGLLQNQTFAASSPDSALVQYSYAPNGFLTSQTQVTGTNDPNVVTTYAYDLRGELTSQTDSAGQKTTYSYDGRGHRTGEERFDASGSLVSWDFTYYNANGEAYWEQGPRYSPNDYDFKQYDADGRVTQDVKWLIGGASDGSGNAFSQYATSVYKYDTFGNMTEMDDPNNNAFIMSYDAVGEMTKRTLPAVVANSSPSESFTYEPGGKLLTHIDSLGGIETRKYTYTGQVYEDDLPDGTIKKYLFDLVGRVTQETLTNGSYWTTTYVDSARQINRVFYKKGGGTNLATESETSDRRGNVTSKTDVSGFTFVSSYDGLNRVKTTSGPPTAGTSARQLSVHTYDAAGQMQTVTNGKGERTVTDFDTLARPTLVSVFNSNGTAASNTSYFYSADHQSVTTTVGTGTGAISDTTYTNTYNQPVLIKHADNTFQVTQFDANDNKIAFLDEQGEVTSWTYDALNHVKTQNLPTSSSSALISFEYNTAGELLLRQMPESITAKTVYDSAGRKTSDELDGPGPTVTRKYTYNYYSMGVDLGLLQSVGDPRGFTMTTTYDDWLRPLTVNSSGATDAHQNQNTTYGYDNRGMANSIAQGYVVGATGPSTLVARGFDGYGEINAETVSVSGTAVSQWKQSWDAAGRRSNLNFQLAALGVGAGSQYAYSYNGSGLMTGVTNTGSAYSFLYGDNNLLQSRTNPWNVESITSRDNRGRITAANTKTGTTTQVSETLNYRSDSRLSSYAISGPLVPAETRNYDYDGRGQLLSEPYLMSGSTNADLPNGPQTASYYFDQVTTPNNQFDNGTEAGLGVRTEQYVNANTANYINSQNSFQQSTADAFASGDGTGGTWSPLYDAAGNESSRTIPSVQAQTFTWDAWNRLVQVSQRLTGTSDFDWTTVYDGLGRRVQTSYQAENNGTPTGNAEPITYYYDPQVEFLELGLNDNGSRTWKIYGPDRSGGYGSLGGCGGLQNEVNENTGYQDVPINDYFGDSIGETYVPAPGGGSNSTYGYGLVLGGYGPEPGTGLNSITPQWRGKYVDYTGLIYFGARYYDYFGSGRFLSADPLGHAASMDLYSYCNDDPVNGLDPDGRFGRGAINTGVNTIDSAAQGLVTLSGATAYGYTSLYSSSLADQLYGSQEIAMGQDVNNLGRLAITGEELTNPGLALADPNFLPSATGIFNGFTAGGSGNSLAYRAGATFSNGLFLGLPGADAADVFTSGIAPVEQILPAAEGSGEILALPGPRQVDYSWGAMNTYREGGDMTAIEHINYRHAFDSGFSNVSRFSEDTSASDIQSYVDQASRYGNVTPQGLNGFKLEYNLGDAIGTNQAGGAANGIRVFIRNGQVQTAFPITIP